MIQKVKSVLKKRKAKLFFLFLLLSGLAWFISSLSDRYQSDTSFELEFVNPPDSMMLVSASKRNMEVKLDAVGFRFLLFNVNKRKVKINLSEAIKKGKRYFVPPNAVRRQMAKQLANGVKLLETESDTLFFEFYGVVSKKVPVKPMLHLEFAQNYLLSGPLRVFPDSVIVKGPENEIDTLDYIKTDKVILSGLNDDFSHVIELKNLSGSDKVLLLKTQVRIDGSVSRFSEKIIHIPVSLINLPDNTSAQTFPERVAVLVKASVAVLKKLKPSDFTVIGDYNSILGKERESIVLSISKKPATIYSAELSKNHVDFILRRE